jgi:pilus assembly protein CpaE
MTASSSAPARVVVIGDPGQIQDQILSALRNQSEFEVVDVLTAKEKLMRELRAVEPDVILIDSELEGEPTLDLMDDLTGNFQDVVLIAILRENDTLKAQQAVLSGARAFIFHPFTQINLIATMRRVYELEKRHRESSAYKVAPSDAARQVRSIVVYSPRGGAGVSTVAANLAIALLEQTNQRVLLFEGKLFFGHLDVLLNLRPHNTLADLIPHASSLDDNLMQDVVTKHITGIDVLMAPESIQVAQGIRPDELYNVFLNVQKYYDFVVVDAGSALSENTVTLMDGADCILMVATPEMAALHDVSRFIQVTRSLAYPPEKLMIVLNRAGLTGGIKSRDIEKAMRHPVFSEIADDEPNALRSLNRGVPLYIRYAGSPASKGIKNLAHNLLELRTAGYAAPPESEKAQREVILASSRLG